MNKNYFMLMNEGLLGDGGGTEPPAAPPAEPPKPSVSIPENWKEALPQELRAEKSLEHIKTVEDMTKSYLSAQKLIGADKIVIPHKHAEQSEWEKVFAKLGRPETADKYEIKLEGAKIDVEAVKKTAHELGLLPQQAMKFAEMMNKNVIESETQLQNKINTQLATATETLKKEWGVDFDRRLKLAQATVAEFGGEELQKYLSETGYGNDPMLVKAFYKISEQFGEDKFKGVAEGIGGLTPDSAMKRINEINADPAFMDKSHPKHDELIAERSRMFRLAYPDLDKK